MKEQHVVPFEKILLIFTVLVLDLIHSISVSSMQLAMVFERVLATYWRADYEKSTYWIGVALIISSLIFSFLAVLWTVLEEHLDSYYGYCSAATPYTSTRLSTLLIMLTIFGIVSLFGFIIIRVYNQSSLKR
uniref:CASP-like protein n=1 Tax=Heterorhabditis bacteriophora TaxID=37862 RepID=A0A1I7XF88_HETBA